MPRSKRLQIPGGVYHVIVRGIEKRNIFNDNRDRVEFITRLSDNLIKYNSKCYAWALLPNHFHLMIRTGTGSLTDVMKPLLTGYAVYFNRKYKRHGYLYQNRYKSVLCQEDAYFQELVRYIHLNPFRAKLVENLEALRDYQWTGHRMILNKVVNKWFDSKAVLSWFGEKSNKALSAYHSFIEEGIDESLHIDFDGGGLVRSVGGWSQLRAMRRKTEYWRGDERILGDSAFVDEVLVIANEQMEMKSRLKRQGWDLDKVVEYVCRMLGITKEEIKNKGRDNLISEAKCIVCYLANKELGISGKDISLFFGISKQAIGKNVDKGKRIVREKGIKLSS